ncbi:MAG TPA: metal-dependent transcriptional regulator [Dissulfurispiraceae bacterium]|nr:metal-dependent transcriptional regulator [Dissulfurispiraceae bacterium]
MDKERMDEALELLWVLDEDGHHDPKRFRLCSDDHNVDELIDMLKGEALVTLTDGGISLTDKGTAAAKGLIRRHRLAERLFTDVFDLSKESMEEDACKVEHILSEELTDSVCTFLGHPPVCPHGKPIPRGECCRRYSVDVRPVVSRLTDFEVGQAGKIVFITPSEAARITRLSSIGIIPGTIIRLLQRKPSIVLQMDETTIAIDPELAKEIFIKKIG